ncbi:MAG TPA: alpha/beta hydrolase [Opitutaceae bacterium]|nr:alpha/beta hydrolase [Opitutaceae bacterium]
MPRFSRLPLSLALFAALLAAPLRAEDAKTFDLWPEGVPGLRPEAPPETEHDHRVANVSQPTLTWYPAPADIATGTAVIVCPGGGYGWLSMEKEGSSPAHWLNGLGVSAFMLKYRVAPYEHPAELRDVLRAVRLVRSRAAEFGIRPDRLGVMGFSAGGHLASCAGTLYDAPEGRTGAALDAVSARPDFLVLIYPVITMREPFAHAGSRRNLLGPNPTEEQLHHLSTDEQVTQDTPPTFLVETTADRTVPVENSLRFYEALRRAGVAGAEMHLYEQGPHGFGLRPGFGAASEWPHLCELWLRQHGWLPAPARP